MEITDEGLKYALYALSFFRHRHDKRSRFKNPSRRRNKEKTVSVNREYVARAREYVKLAREHGWRGSIVDEFKVKEKGGEGSGSVVDRLRGGA
jgi:hypothetical protein